MPGDARWIAVEEREPPEGEVVLALRRRCRDDRPEMELCVRKRIGDLCGEGHPNASEVTWYAHHFRAAYRKDSVNPFAFSHWMPLPEPPRV